MKPVAPVTGGILAGVVLAGVVLAPGCGSAPAPASAPRIIRGVAAAEPSADPRPYGAADTAFGLDVLSAWCRQEPDSNIVFSPESLASGLGMAYLGARGATAQAMARVLHLPATGPGLQAGLHARSAALRSLGQPGVTLAPSDLIWADPGLPPRAGYLNDLASGYDAGVRQAPLQRDPAAAAAQIDAAVAAQTRGRIPHLLTAADVDGSGWVLTDALYLSADWDVPFQASQTEPGTFTTAAGRQATAQFMNGSTFPATTSGGWTGVSLPYRGGKLTMVALLPDAAAGSAAGACPAPAAATLTAITTALAQADRNAGRGTPGPGPAGSRPGPLPAGQPPGAVSGRVAVALPKVGLQSSTAMKNLLTGLGMGVAFGTNADFTGLSPRACCIGTVVHAATLDVGEKGTVGSAATGVGILPSSAIAEPVVIRFNRPYLMLVTDTRTGEPLFLARVASP